MTRSLAASVYGRVGVARRLSLGLLAAVAALVLLGPASAGSGSEGLWLTAGQDPTNTRWQPAETRIGVGNAVDVHDGRRRLGDAGGRREHGVRPRLGREPVRDRQEVGHEGLVAQGLGVHRGFRRPGSHDAGRGRQQAHLRRSGRALRRRCQRDRGRQTDGQVALDHEGRIASLRVRDAVRGDVQRQQDRLCRRRVVRGGDCGLHSRLRVLHVSWQHPGAERRHRPDPLEDLHGPGGLQRRSGLGQHARDRQGAEQPLHRHRQQLFRSAIGEGLRGRSGERPGCGPGVQPSGQPLRLDHGARPFHRRHQVGEVRPAVRCLEPQLPERLRLRRSGPVPESDRTRL